MAPRSAQPGTLQLPTCRGACPDEDGPISNNLAPITPFLAGFCIFCPFGRDCSSEFTPLSFLFYINFSLPSLAFCFSTLVIVPWKKRSSHDHSPVYYHFTPSLKLAFSASPASKTTDREEFRRHQTIPLKKRCVGI